MHIISECEACLYKKQSQVAMGISDEVKRSEFLGEIRDMIDNRKEEDTSPYLLYLFYQIYDKYGLKEEEYPNELYNRLMLDIEADIEAKIRASSDPLMTSLVYARVGNYIDFSVMDEVDPQVVVDMLEKENSSLDETTYQSFCQACSEAKTFLLLCDNCGEIVLDKLFIRQLKRQYPHLQISAMVRGDKVLNDVTMEDAIFTGLTEEAHVISNGNAVSGTVEFLLSQEAKDALHKADVILSKGQGNYETMSEYKGKIFYSFLCKCDLFVTRFQVPQFTGMFIEGH